MARTQAQRDYATEMRQEPRLIMCRDGALRVTPYGDRPAEVEDVSIENVPAALDASRLTGDVSLLRKDVRACYEGTALARAHAVAKLKPANHMGIFGAADDPTYMCGRLYRRIGRTVTDHCPLHLVSREDCAACTEHRATCAALKDATVNVLKVAYKFTDPIDQRNAVLFVQSTKKRMRNKRDASGHTQANVRHLYTRVDKLEETLADIKAGKLSFSKDLPAEVSKLDTVRNGLFVLDGHHRIVEQMMDGKSSVSVFVSVHVPYIERTGGAYRNMLDGMVNIQEWVTRNMP